VYGSIQESEMICRRLANATGSPVIAVEYRLAPEHKFPVPLEDCYDATMWASAKYPKILVAGESAGGNLAAAVALMAKDKQEFSLAGQLLMYPVLTSDLNAEHYQNSPDKSLLSYENMQFFWQAYLDSPESGNLALASPLKSTDLSGLPPAFIITADYDALKHEGEAYGKKLGNAKVKCYPQVIHGFLDLPLREDVREEAVNDITAWIQSIN
jgi:acetyl esterase